MEVNTVYRQYLIVIDQKKQQQQQKPTYKQATVLCQVEEGSVRTMYPSILIAIFFLLALAVMVS